VSGKDFFDPVKHDLIVSLTPVKHASLVSLTLEMHASLVSFTVVMHALPVSLTLVRYYDHQITHRILEQFFFKLFIGLLRSREMFEEKTNVKIS
jgi:hypothetical protein